MGKLIKGLVKQIKKLGIKYRKLLLIGLIVYGLILLGIGTFIGSFFNKATLDKFPKLNRDSKILIAAPHIDDEVIATGGLIQKAIKAGAEIKIIYLTNGDNNLNSVIVDEDKNLKIGPDDFITLGETRMAEGRQAAKDLGLSDKNLEFLGYPDQGLSQLFNNYYSADKKYSAKGIKFTYNPYAGTYRSKQDYNGENIVNDLSTIMNSFQPNILIIPHPLDQHPDHKATFRFFDKVLAENPKQNDIKVWLYLVHYKNYPADKLVAPNKFLFPPSKLFSQSGWFSLDLDKDEIQVKLKALSENKTQLVKIPLLDSRMFIRRNEIFEIHEF